MLNKCGLCHFRCFVQLIKVTVSFESLFFVRSILYFCFCFCFFPCLSLFYFQLSRVIEVSSARTFFIFFVPFSYLSYFLRIFQLRFLFLISAHSFCFSFLASFQAFQILLHFPCMGILRFVPPALCQTKYYFMGASRWEATAARDSVPSAS